MPNIIIIEDDSAILRGLKISLEQEHYVIETESDGLNGYEKAISGNFDLIILDLMLPGKSGMDICRDLRNKKINTPILMLTSKNEELDKVLGLEFGADDYVTKPFSLKELHARIRALLRRSEFSQNDNSVIEFGNISIDFTKQNVLKNNKSIKLTSKELKILKYFFEHEGEVISRSTLLNKIWGYEVYPTTRTVDNYILNIRKKIEDDPSNPKHLITIPTSGYKFVK